jgi:hypothetical protein
MDQWPSCQTYRQNRAANGAISSGCLSVVNFYVDRNAGIRWRYAPGPSERTGTSTTGADVRKSSISTSAVIPGTDSITVGQIMRVQSVFLRLRLAPMATAIGDADAADQGVCLQGTSLTDGFSRQHSSRCLVSPALRATCGSPGLIAGPRSRGKGLSWLSCPRSLQNSIAHRT